MMFSSEAAQAVAESIARFGEQTAGKGFQQGVTAPFSRERWRKLAEIGVLALQPGLGTGENEMLFAASVALGRIGFPGPLPASFLAAALVNEEDATAIGEGNCLVSLGSAPLMPWASEADLFLSIKDSRALRLETGNVRAMDTLGGEGWGEVEIVQSHPLGDWRPHRCCYDLPLAGYLIGAARRLVEETAAYAGERKQFGKLIGEFQGVALPLAGASTRIDAAFLLGQMAALRLDEGASNAETLVSASRNLASEAARGMAAIAHQTFGAIGTVADGPVFTLSRRIEQWSRQPPIEELPDTIVDLASEGSLCLMYPADCEPENQPWS